jgi:uncharacterized protein YndB with AHSA1/START domain
VSKARKMREQNYTTSFTVDQSPEEVFDAVKNVRGWWMGDIAGDTTKLGDEFEYRSGDVHRSTQKITEFEPGRKVVWHVTDSQLNFIQDKNEWTGTNIVFDITQKNGRTELRFTHVGLAPVIECYDSCSDAWSYYINQSLFTLITQGKGEPEHKDRITESATTAR